MEHPLSGRSSPLLKKEKGIILALKSMVHVCVCVCTCVLLSDCVTFKPMVCSLTDFSVHRILQERRLERTAIPFSRGSSTLTSELQEDSSLPEAPGKTLKSTAYI